MTRKSFIEAAVTEPVAAPPRWRRRKTARPGEIVAAAMAVFAEKGFAAARLEDIAARAGVSKAALYLYFETKTDLFRAVVGEAVVPNIERIRLIAEAYNGRFADILPVILGRLAQVAQTSPLGGVAKMVVGESRNFPDLARVWHDAVVSQGLGLLTALIERAQSRGEVRAGDPRLMAVSVAGAMLVGILFDETFVPVGAEPIHLPTLAAQHARTVLDGMLSAEARP
jgi:AcrR family transcriptional regulator